jgi:hypothetical protein
MSSLPEQDITTKSLPEGPVLSAEDSSSNRYQNSLFELSNMHFVSLWPSCIKAGGPRADDESAVSGLKMDQLDWDTETAAEDTGELSLQTPPTDGDSSQHMAATPFFGRRLYSPPISYSQKSSTSDSTQKRLPRWTVSELEILLELSRDLREYKKMVQENTNKLKELGYTESIDVISEDEQEPAQRLIPRTRQFGASTFGSVASCSDFRQLLDRSRETDYADSDSTFFPSSHGHLVEPEIDAKLASAPELETEQ